jgi:hypothetical protein
MPTTWLSSARARFAVTAATVLALVALGGVTAAPANADVNIRITVIDAQSGSPLANQALLFGPTGTAYGVTTDASGGFGWGGPGWSDGSYTLINPNPGIYVDPAPLILDASITQATISLERYKVTGSIPVDAANGLTTFSIEQDTGSWGSVGSGSVSSATGDFEIRLPNGPGDYRLRFTPSSSTDYLETVSSSFTVGGGVPIVDLGAISFESARVISGAVYREDGTTAISGATVTASAGGSDVASGTSDGGGAYRILLPASDATYTLRVTATGFEDQEWNVVTPGSDTVAVNATAGYIHSGVDFALVGLPVVISGTVLNFYSFDESPAIQLYSGGATPTLVDETTMGPTGDYSFAPVPSGDYYIKVIPAEGDEFLETLLGDAGYTEWAKSASVEAAFASAHAFTADATDPSSATDHDLIVEYASILIGFLSYNSTGIPGCVRIIDVADPTVDLCAVADADGRWYAHVRVGHSYKLEAVPDGYTYLPQWWWNASDESSALAIGPVTPGLYASYTFYVPIAPATVTVNTVDETGTDPITVHIYYKDGADEWRDLTEADTDPANTITAVSFAEDYSTGTQTGLYDGDYRVRFEAADGTWLAATAVSAGTYPDSAAGPAPACYVDIDDVADGAPYVITATFTAASATQGCGAQQFNYGEVTGSVEASSSFGSAAVADHLVTLSNSGSSRSAVTASDGSFEFSYVPNDSYDVQVTPQSHVTGGHEYSYSATDLALGNGDVDLGALVATRYGNAYGQISNWDPLTMSGVATVYMLDDCGCWSPGPLSVDIAPDGRFEVPGVAVDGEYAVLVQFDSTYAPVFLGGGYPSPADPFTGVAEQDYNLGFVAVEVNQYVTISGSVFFGDEPIDGGVVIAIPDGDESAGVFGASTNPDGSYEIEVAPNVDYEVLALDPGEPLMLQTYDGHNYSPYFTGVMDFDPVEVTTSEVTGIGFSLVAVDEVTFDIYTYSWDAATDDYDELEDVDVHLYKKVAGAWQQIATFSSEDYAEAYLEVIGDGDYRLGFSKGGAWLAMHDLYAASYYPYEDPQDAELDFSPAQCFYDVPDLRHGTYFTADVSLVAAPAGSECGPDLPVSVPTTPTTKKPHRPASLVEQLADDVTAAQPTPTPTPTPSETATDEPGSEPDCCAPAASGPDLTWAFWAAGVLVLLLLAGGAVYFVRRRP